MQRPKSYSKWQNFHFKRVLHNIDSEHQINFRSFQNIVFIDFGSRCSFLDFFECFLRSSDTSGEQSSGESESGDIATSHLLDQISERKFESPLTKVQLLSLGDLVCELNLHGLVLLVEAEHTAHQQEQVHLTVCDWSKLILLGCLVRLATSPLVSCGDLKLSFLSLTVVTL